MWRRPEESCGELTRVPLSSSAHANHAPPHVSSRPTILDRRRLCLILEIPNIRGLIIEHPAILTSLRAMARARSLDAPLARYDRIDRYGPSCPQQSEPASEPLDAGPSYPHVRGGQPSSAGPVHPTETPRANPGQACLLESRPPISCRIMGRRGVGRIRPRSTRCCKLAEEHRMTLVSGAQTAQGVLGRRAVIPTVAFPAGSVFWRVGLAQEGGGNAWFAVSLKVLPSSGSGGAPVFVCNALGLCELERLNWGHFFPLRTCNSTEYAITGDRASGKEG